MIDKRVASVAEAVAGIKDGSHIMVAGFGYVGQPNALLNAVIELGVRDLTIIANNAGGSGVLGLGQLIKLRRVCKVICSYPKSVDPAASFFEDLYREGQIELELVPQGTLTERMRSAGVGIPAFFTPTGAGTKLAEGKETREIGGRECVLETALTADVALVEAWEADRFGNLTYRQSGRNFNPVMAMAAALTVVQAQHFVEAGQIDPEHVVTPGIFVDRVVHVPYGDPL